MPLHGRQLLDAQQARRIDTEPLSRLGRHVRPSATVREQHAGHIERPTARLVESPRIP